MEETERAVVARAVAGHAAPHRIPGKPTGMGPPRAEAAVRADRLGRATGMGSPRAEAAARAGRCLLPPSAEAEARAGWCLLPPRAEAAVRATCS